MTYTSTSTIGQLASRLAAAKRVLITTHSKPDGDAMGSVLALQRALSSKSITADIVLVGPVENGLRLLARETPYRVIAKEREMPGDDYDLALVVDTGAWSQLEPQAAWLKRNSARVVGIDHHARGDDVASARIVDPSCASTTQLLVSVLDALGWALTGGSGGLSEPLFAGLATDTGWFRFANADARVFETAARLLATGIDKSWLYETLEENFRSSRLRIEARALASLELLQDDVVAVQTLSIADFAETGAGSEDLTGIVNMPMTVGTVRVSVLIAQHTEGLVKVSFRSKLKPLGAPPGPVDHLLDVNQLAARFGGGGHVQAAGAKMNGTLVEVKARVMAALAGGERMI